MSGLWCSQISLVSSCHLSMDARCLQTARGTSCSKPRAPCPLCGGGRVVVWAGTQPCGRTALVHVAGALTGIRYRDDILQHHVIPHMNVNGGTFQHDSACPHVARASREFLQRHRVQT